MSRSSAHEVNGVRRSTDPQTNEFYQTIHAYMSRTNGENEEQDFANDLPPGLLSSNVLSRKDFLKYVLKRHFKRQTPPENLKESLLEKIRHLSV